MLSNHEHVMRWRGSQVGPLQDATRELDVEGALRASKTTLCLRKVLNSCLDYPKIHWLICRWTDDATHSLLAPRWRELCREAGVSLKWNSQEQYDELSNGSIVYIRGLKTQDQTLRASKFRGLTLAGVYWDQTEEGGLDVYLELAARLSQKGFPQQIIISPQSVNDTHWIAQEFPADNRLPHRRYYALSVYDNAHNLDKEVIPNLERLFPEGHPLHRTLILGKRGMNVTGDPVYKAAFVRALHEQPAEYDPKLPLEMALDFGKHHPCVVFRQVSSLGQVRFIGGILGQQLYLDDFLDIVLRYRAQWFPEPCEIRECCDPAGVADTSHGTQGAIVTLHKRGIHPRSREDSNSPTVRLAMIERMAAQMRRRSANREEGFVISTSDRWLRISEQSTMVDRFLADGFEAGYVWDEHMVSVNNKQVRRPKKDGWYEHGQNCFDAETDVLTDSGWRRFADLSPLDALATVDMGSDGLQYQRPSRLIRQEYEGPMVRFAGKLDALVTPEHRMVVYPRCPEVPRYAGPKPWDGPVFDPTEPIIRLATDLDRFDRVKLRATWNGVHPDVMLVPRTRRADEKELDPGDWAEFLGWYVAEGSYSKRIKSPEWGHRVVVSQKKPEGVERLGALLARLPWKFHRVSGGFQASSEQLRRVVEPLGDAYTKSIPQWIRWASTDLIHRFLRGAIAGDGHITATGHRMYFTVSSMLADQMQELFIKAGTSASITRKPAGSYHIGGRTGATVEQFHLNEWTTPAAAVRDSRSRRTTTTERYQGLVYCATVPNGTLIVRRGGRPFVAGNCAEYLEANFGDSAAKPEPPRAPDQRLKGWSWS